MTRPVFGYLSRQAARPHGLIGRLLARIWVSETAPVNDVAIDLLDARPGEQVVEIGFGPGRTLGWLAAEGANVYGIDVSPTMLAVAHRRNAHLITAGRLELALGDGTKLPLPDDAADAVLAVHSIYFWPDPATTLVDAARILRRGGRLVLGFRTGEHPLPRRFDRSVYRVPATGQVVTWLEQAGFTDIEAHRRPDIEPALVWLTAALPLAKPTALKARQPRTAD